MVLSLSIEHNNPKKGIAIHTSYNKEATVAWQYIYDNDPQAKYHPKTNSVCNKNKNLERYGVFWTSRIPRIGSNRSVGASSLAKALSSLAKNAPSEQIMKRI